LVESVTRLVVQELLEGEQRDFLGGRGRYDRRDDDQVGSRNGYERGRLRTAEGFVEVAVPQVRGAGEPFRSSLMGFLDGNSEVLESLVNEMYARGLSTRDVEDAFRDATGELLISKSAVSEITDRLWEDYQDFLSRDLSGLEIEYLFVDAVFESLRRHGAKRRGEGGAAGRLGDRLRRRQTPVAPGGRQQGVRGLLDGVLLQPARPRAAAADHRDV
jgi:transposase-like protein